MESAKYRLNILIAAFLWGVTGVYFKELSAIGTMPMQAVFLRTSIATLGLGLWLLVTNRKAFLIRFEDLWCFLGTGVLSLLFFNWCFFNAIIETGMAVAGVLLYTAPAFVTVLSALLFKEKLKLPGWVLLALIMTGCALTSGISGGVSGTSTAGILYGLGSGLGYALYSIFGRYALNLGYRPLTISFYTFAFCSIGSIPFVVSSPGVSLPSLMATGPIIWAYALALGILGCLLPYWFYTKGLSGVTGATASMTATFEPVVAALFGLVLYREALTFWQGAGMVIVLGGIILLAKITSEKEAETPKRG